MSGTTVDFIRLHQFRNLQPLQLQFPAPLNIIVGPNAQGKTNLLEALHLLVCLRPFRAARNRELVAWEAAEAEIQARVRTPIGPHDVAITLRPTSRIHRMDGKVVRSTTSLDIASRAVFFSPDALTLVKGSPAQRRDWLDTAILHLYPRYQTLIRDYQHIVMQKNKLLNQEQYSDLMLDVWEARQLDIAAHVIMTRARFIRRIQPLLASTFARLSGNTIHATMAYQTSIELDEAWSVKDIRAQLEIAQQEKRQEERRRQMALVGPHRDDLLMSLDNRPASVYASQGQIRMLSICLKMLEVQTILEDLKVVPVFLLDDVSSELDRQKNALLMRYLQQTGCQTFVTTTSVDHLELGEQSETAFFSVNSGLIVPVDSLHT